MVATCHEDELQAAALVKRRWGHQIGHQGNRSRKLKGAGRPEQDKHPKEEERICAALQRKRQKRGQRRAPQR